MDRRKKIKRLRRALDRLSTSTIVVEGRRDVLALSKAGFSAIPFHAALKKPLSFPVVVLTDLDREGDRKASFLYSLLSPYGEVDVTLRRELAFLLNLSHFEGFYKRLKAVEEELGWNYGKGVY